MKKIIKFKSRKDQLNDDLQKLIKDKNTKFAFLVYANEKDLKEINFNCSLSDLKMTKEILEKRIKEWEFEDYLREHLVDFFEC